MVFSVFATSLRAYLVASRYSGSGSDRSFWIEAYGGRPYRYDRVNLKDDAIDVPFNAVSLIGGIQPDRLHSLLLAGDDDGLAARPLYAWPDPVPPHRPSCTVDDTKMEAALRCLLRLKFDTPDNKTIRPHVVSLHPEAAEAFERWWKGTQWQAKVAASGKLAGAVGKLEGIVLRLALILEYLTWAWGGGNAPEPATLSFNSVVNAMRLVDDWVRPNLERVFAEASLPQDQKDAATVARWLLKAKPTIVNARDLRRRAGFPGPKKANDLDAALEVLVDARWLTRQCPANQTGRHAKDFRINPAIYRVQ